MTKENRIALYITLGVIFVVGTTIGLLVFFTRGPNYATLRKGLKEKNGLDAKSFDLKGEQGQLQVGTVTTEQGETYPIVVHIGRSRPNVYNNQITVSTQWILGKQPPVAEGEIRKLVESLGFEISSLQLQPNPNGVGYIGEATAKSGEMIDISENLKGPPYSSAQLAELRPSSYDRWIRNTLKKDLKEEVTSVSEFVPKSKSWAMEEGARQDRVRAEEVKRWKRLKEQSDKRMEEIRRSGRQPTLGEIGAARAMLGPEPVPPVNVKDLMSRFGIDQKATSQSVTEYKSATATTKTGRVIELEIEIQNSSPKSVKLSWQEGKKVK